MGNVINAIQNAVKATVKVSKPSRYSKHWWNKELDEMQTHKNKLSSKAYRHKDDPDHNAHAELREYRNKYNSAIDDTKQTHWKRFLEDADEHTLWTAGRYVQNPNGEGAASPRIPTLRTKNGDGTDRISKTNADTAEVIAKAFFPPPPADHGVPEDYNYPPPRPSMQDSPGNTSVARSPPSLLTRPPDQTRSPMWCTRSPLTC